MDKSGKWEPADFDKILKHRDVSARAMCQILIIGINQWSLWSLGKRNITKSMQAYIESIVMDDEKWNKAHKIYLNKKDKS